MTVVERFLSDRLIDRGSDWVGISSNAMVAEAISGREVPIQEYPRDLADLSRCCATFARAPWELKEKMLPRLFDYCQHLSPPEQEPQPLTIGLALNAHLIRFCRMHTDRPRWRRLFIWLSPKLYRH